MGDRLNKIIRDVNLIFTFQGVGWKLSAHFCLICFCPVINFPPQRPACVWSEHAGELMRVMRQCFLHYTAADVPFTPRRWQLKRWHKCQSSNFLTLLKIWPAEFPHLFFDCSPAASLSGWPGDFSPRCGSQTSVEELPGGEVHFR